MPGRDPGGTRYSTLTQITPANVSQLKVAWVYHMKPAPPAGGVSSTGFKVSEDQPLVVGQTMYVATPYSRVVALDSATGREQWAFQIPDGDQASSRGATSVSYTHLDVYKRQTLTKAFGIPKLPILGENAKFEIRVDAFNLLNNLNFSAGSINTSISNDGLTSNPGFGQATSALGSRTLDLQARFSF